MKLAPLIYVPSSELGYCLKISHVQVAIYGRLGLFPRVPHPHKQHAFQYELIGSLTRYVSILDQRLRARSWNPPGVMPGLPVPARVHLSADRDENSRPPVSRSDSSGSIALAPRREQR